ncbi:MAG TPA: GNAT family N-acetyltransferase [Phycisphaerae bacterium]|nr:GNAT family N-acetyltransferase [Phycisphaerae bacterium]HOJ75012.1 GNAT family N-acetyltransferase [Phycisphaerae bacterium]HOM51883.1 GNAT family N-acetyltransferase [Phycisphaerae bacterium]HOQ84935.1 GNAT family N-acetyltransferase [Phycisphaerae bacterium]HPP28830.1 GNAT family N-acetyltransferase [Phycisphaerae bacterium]
MSIQIRGPLFGVASRCEPVLAALPDWFGNDSSVQAYVRTIDALPTFIAEYDGQCAGFLAIKQQNPYAAEIYVTAVRCELHRRGIGRRLLTAAEDWMRSTGIEYAYLKTLGPSREYEPCERTRRFYFALGYRPLEELKRLWANDPCLIMVKRLADGTAPARMTNDEARMSNE